MVDVSRIVCEWGDEVRTKYEKIFPHVLVTKTNYAEYGVEDSAWVFEEKVKTGESRVAKGEIRQIAVKDIPDLITRILQGKNTSDYMQLPLENFLKGSHFHFVRERFGLGLPEESKNIVSIGSTTLVMVGGMGTHTGVRLPVPRQHK